MAHSLPKGDGIRIQSDRYELLDALRGVAALGVLLYHLAWQMDLERFLFAHGYLAVDFFFMLSGFVIANAYDDRLRSGAMAVRTFIVARLVRVYPMIFIGTLVGIAVRVPLMAINVVNETVMGTFGQTIAALAIVPIVYDAAQGAFRYDFPINGPIWSLFWELIANLAYASMLVKFRPSLRATALLCLVAAAALTAYALHNNGVDRALAWQAGLLRVSFSFFFGTLLWHFRHKVAPISVPVGYLVLTLILILACPLLPHINALFDVGVILIMFPALVFLASRHRSEGRARAAFNFLGAVSFPLYALHGPFLRVLDHMFTIYRWNYGVSLLLMVVLPVVAVVISYLVLIKIDMPVRRWLRDRTTRTQPRQPAVEPG